MAQQHSDCIFSIIPIEVFLDDRLTKTDLRVLGAMMSWCNKNTNMMWPKREQISARCGLSLSKISTATTHLVELGWLKKQGIGGCSRASQYEFLVPDLDAKIVPESGTKTVPDSGTGIKQTIEHKEKEKEKEKKSKNPLPENPEPQHEHAESFHRAAEMHGMVKQIFTVPEWIDKKLWVAWMAVRKSKKQVNTDIALKRLVAELVICQEAGISPTAAITLAIENSWAGLKLSWILNAQQKTVPTPKPHSGPMTYDYPKVDTAQVLKELAAMKPQPAQPRAGYRGVGGFGQKIAKLRQAEIGRAHV